MTLSLNRIEMNNIYVNDRNEMNIMYKIKVNDINE